MLGGEEKKATIAHRGFKGRAKEIPDREDSSPNARFAGLKNHGGLNSLDRCKELLEDLG